MTYSDLMVPLLLPRSPQSQMLTTLPDSLPLLTSPRRRSSEDVEEPGRPRREGEESREDMEPCSSSALCERRTREDRPYGPLR